MFDWLLIVYLAGFIGMVLALTAATRGGRPRLSLREGLIGSALWFITLPLGVMIAHKVARKLAQ